jgi:transposase-like protein
MRLTASKKQEIIHIVTRSIIGVNRTRKRLGSNKSTFNLWYKLYSDFGVVGLSSNERVGRRHRNVIPSQQNNLVVELALQLMRLFRLLMNIKTRLNLFIRCGKRISPILE